LQFFFIILTSLSDDTSTRFAKGGRFFCKKEFEAAAKDKKLQKIANPSQTILQTGILSLLAIKRRQ
jgi:hypothetical protein